MFRTWTFGMKVAAGFVVSTLIMITVAMVGFLNADRLIENDRLVAHTHEVIGTLEDLLARIVDAETGQRGYVITGNDTYLEPYRAALGEIRKTFDTVRRLTADNPNQQRRLDLMSPIIDTRLATLNTVIDLRRTAGSDAAARSISSNRGKDLMDQIRRLAADMRSDEQGLLVQRAARAEASARAAKIIMIAGSILGAVLVVAIGWFITKSLSTQIGAAVQHVQSSSAELQSTASQQATGAKEQSTAVNEISTTINELLVTTRQIADSAQRVAQIAEQTSTAARSGDGTVMKAQESIGGIRRQVDLVVSHMLELGQKSQQIGTVLDIVSELAEQTNILAINATIEAAGAGEAGQRFAVVADEIRKLADRVAGSTKEVRTLIEDVRTAVNTTVMATETGSKAVDAGSRQFDDVAAVFKQIADLVTTTTEAAREIELSTKQQTTAVEQVNLAIANVAQTTRETEASSGQTLQTASQLSVLSRDLLRLVQPQAA
jgi:methyl-accepting chemotaxis protein